MQQQYDSRYFTLHHIPEHRQEFIETKLRWFTEIFNIREKDRPIDCIQLLKKMDDEQKIPFTYGPINASQKVDALAIYHPKHNVYLMQLNKNKIKYPFTRSKDRRTNFTIAHEIGHIVLDHLHIPKECKTGYEIFIEEQEANEFAGRLLMPKRLILSSNFISIDKVATHFNVSNQAIWMRLNHLQRLDLLKSIPSLVCETCGNKDISPFVNYCHICGDNLYENTNGVSPINYNDGYNVDSQNRLCICPVCQNEDFGSDASYCKICGLYLYNRCTNTIYPCDHLNQSNARYCENCGRETSFLINEILDYWYIAKEKMIELTDST